MICCISAIKMALVAYDDTVDKVSIFKRIRLSHRSATKNNFHYVYPYFLFTLRSSDLTHQIRRSDLQNLLT